PVAVREECRQRVLVGVDIIGDHDGRRTTFDVRACRGSSESGAREDSHQRVEYPPAKDVQQHSSSSRRSHTAEHHRLVGPQPRRYSCSRLCPGGTVRRSNWRRPDVRSSIGSSLFWRILQTIYCTISACHERCQSPPERGSSVSPRAVCSIERPSTRSSTRASSVILVSSIKGSPSSFRPCSRVWAMSSTSTARRPAACCAACPVVVTFV